MKLAYLANQRLPTEKAYGIQIVRMCQAFSETGLDVILITPTRKGAQGDDIRGYYDVPRDAFQIVRLWGADFHWPGPLDRLAFWFTQSLSATRIVWYVLNIHPDYIYTRDALPAILLGFCGRRIFYEEHRDRSWFFYRLLSWLKVPVITTTHALRRQLIACGFDSKRIIVAHDGVDHAAFSLHLTQEQTRHELHLPEGQPIIGYVGSLRTLGAEKGIHDLLRAFSLVRKQIPDARLLIVGGGAEGIAQYRQQAVQLGIDSCVLFPGYQRHDQIPRYLRSLDVAVMPFPKTKHYAQNMSPLKLFEYMASGTPIVTTDLPTVREVLSEREAFFCQPNDPSSLAQALLSAFQDPEESARRAAAAQVLVQRYSWSTRAHSIVSFFGNRI